MPKQTRKGSESSSILGVGSDEDLQSNFYLKVRVRQIVCPVIPGIQKSVIGPLDILPGCSIGTLDLALAASVNSITPDQISCYVRTSSMVPFKASRVDQYAMAPTPVRAVKP